MKKAKKAPSAATKTKAAGAKKKAGATRKAATKKKASAGKKLGATKKTRATRRSDEDVREIQARLARAMQDTVVELDFESPWQLLIATILSAQSTDKMVNKVTRELFRRWPSPAALAGAAQEDVEEVVKPTGFFRNKAKSVRSTSQALVERFASEVPRTLEELITLPGVARKTANVVLGAAYRIPSGIAVDTHAGRVARRLALTAHEDPVKVEADLCEQFPQGTWIDGGHALVLHGRYVCTARKPACARCPINELCPSREAPPEGSWEQRADDENALVLSRGEK